MSEKIIEIEFNRDDKPTLFIKTSKEYENYLSNSGTLQKTTQFLNQEDTNTEFYRLPTSLFNGRDDITSSLFIYGEINRAVLRVKGISDGITLDLTKCGLMNIENIENEIRRLLTDFKKFYKNNLTKVKIKATLELNDI